MRWRTGRRSDNVEDRRGRRVRGPAIAGGAGMLIVAVIAMLMGKGDIQQLLQQLLGGAGGLGGGAGGAPAENVELSPEQRELGEFVSVVLADTEDTWNSLLGTRYREPTLVLFSGATQSGCGFAQSAIGPFYCPADQKVYIDLSFYDDLKRRHGAPGDFAQAYVIAHEVGHHIQNLLGISDKVHQARQRLNETEYNKMSVRLELQADFLAGVWAHHAHKARGIIERGDVEEALNAASAIGDDRLQKQARGYVQPDSFTHGTSAQRVRWFKLGLERGDVKLMERAFELPYESL